MLTANMLTGASLRSTATFRPFGAGVRKRAAPCSGAEPVPAPCLDQPVTLLLSSVPGLQSPRVDPAASHSLFFSSCGQNSAASATFVMGLQTPAVVRVYTQSPGEKDIDDVKTRYLHNTAGNSDVFFFCDSGRTGPGPWPAPCCPLLSLLASTSQI